MDREEAGRWRAVVLGILALLLIALAYHLLVQHLRDYAYLQEGRGQVGRLKQMWRQQQGRVQAEEQAEAESSGPETPAEGRLAEERLWGKNLVLSLVATGQLDPADPEQLALLFRYRVVPEGIDAPSYEGVTLEALRTRRFPHLTDILGPAREYDASTAAPGSEGAVLFALELPFGLVVAYTDSLDFVSADDPLLDGGELTGVGVRIPAWLSGE